MKAGNERGSGDYFLPHLHFGIGAGEYIIHKNMIKIEEYFPAAI